ncbi:MAG: PAS domain S-box protein [Chloroflexota bacterium]
MTTEERWKFIFENIQDVIWTMDIRTRKFTYVSPSVEKLVGFTPEEMLNIRIADFVTPDSRKKIEGMLERILEGYYSGIRENLYIGEIEEYTKSGSTVWLEVTISLITDEKGELTELFGVSRNITERKKRAKELEESERRYRELADFLPQIIYELDLEGNVTFVNKSGLAMFGIMDDEVAEGRVNAYNFFIPEDVERMRQNRVSIMGSNTETRLEFTAKRINGETFPVSIYGAPKINEKGETIGTRGIIVDISDLKSTQQALARSEERYRKMIASLQEGLYVIRDGKFAFLNDAIVQIVGYQVEELVGKSFLDVIAPESRELVAGNYAKRMRGEDSPHEYEAMLLHKDGARVPAIISVSDGEYDGAAAVIGTARDISERKRAEQEIIDRERRLNAILDAALVGIALFEINGALVDCNTKWHELFGYSREEMERITYREFTYPGDLEETQLFLERLTNGEIRSYRLEKRYLRRDGKVFWGELSVRSITNGKGQPIALVASLFDLTERKQIEEELRKAQEKLKFELEKETIRSQFETLKNQVNPHFLFNSLNVLTSLIKLDPDTAEMFTEQLSKVYRYVLENKDKDLVTLATELEFMKSYKFLLEIRFKDKVTTEIDIDENKLSMQTPTLALQLLIENAIKHNSFSKRQPLHIKIFVDEFNYLNVTNNLQFREGASVSSTGVGLKNIANRYRFLTNKKPFFGPIDTKFVAKIPLLDRDEQM